MRKKETEREREKQTYREREGERKIEIQIKRERERERERFKPWQKGPGTKRASDLVPDFRFRFLDFRLRLILAAPNPGYQG